MTRSLLDLTGRPAPQPWRDGENIPWDEPGFSRRMLDEHLSQAHDAASRRFETIDRHVDFIHRRVLGGRSGRILDLGCGPGLYASRLARLGHHVHGVDFSPAAIAYARETAAAEGLDCRYTLSDMRIARFEPGTYDLAMQIYGEFNVFDPASARRILENVRAALKPGGRLLLEVSTAESVHSISAQPATWSAAPRGLFAETPHLLLREPAWDEASRCAIVRHYLVDAATGTVTRYATTYRAYTTGELTALLESAGFRDACIYPALTGEAEADEPRDQAWNFFVITAARGLD